MNQFLDDYKNGLSVTFRLLGVALILSIYVTPFQIAWELLPGAPWAGFIGAASWLFYLLTIPLVFLFAARLVGLRQTSPAENEAAHQDAVERKNRELAEEAGEVKDDVP